MTPTSEQDNAITQVDALHGLALSFSDLANLLPDPHDERRLSVNSLADSIGHLSGLHAYTVDQARLHSTAGRPATPGDTVTALAMASATTQISSALLHLSRALETAVHLAQPSGPEPGHTSHDTSLALALTKTELREAARQLRIHADIIPAEPAEPAARKRAALHSPTARQHGPAARSTAMPPPAPPSPPPTRRDR